MKKIIETQKAPKPIGPYSQAVIIKDTLYASGQIAVDPVSGALITEDIEHETKRVMLNLKAVLQQAGMNFDHVLKSTIYLKNMDDFVTVNKIYGSFFDPNNAPARETVQVARLPKDVHVEISVIASF